ncbi:17488_t:CDS:2 [Gigaspora rosea]|nr:17488_t:CDS:2 [Gigaspora rosea]
MKDYTWALALREIITPHLVLNFNPVKLKAWPNEWKPYVKHGAESKKRFWRDPIGCGKNLRSRDTEEERTHAPT